MYNRWTITAMPRRTKAILISFLFAGLASAAGPDVVALWPPSALRPDAMSQKEIVTENAAHEHTVTNIHNPTITVYLPPKERATGVAVVIAPGGGHRFLSIDHEGYDVGKWFASIGVAGFVLKYRLARAENSPYKIDDAWHDTQRAIRIIRARAAEWNVNPQKVGVLGFSAGGELAAMAETKYDAGEAGAPDVVERQSSRPDFAVLMYPGINGANYTVTKDTPPTFLCQADNDRQDATRTVLPLYAALKANGVPAELHIFTHGGHGFGIRPSRFPISHWPERLQEWMADTGLLPKQ